VRCGPPGPPPHPWLRPDPSPPRDAPSRSGRRASPKPRRVLRWATVRPSPRRHGPMCRRSCAVVRTARAGAGAGAAPCAGRSPCRPARTGRSGRLRPPASGRDARRSHLPGKGRHFGHGKRFQQPGAGISPDPPAARRSGNAFGAVPCGTAPKPSPVGAPRGAKWLRTGFRPRGHLRTPGYTGRSPPQDLGRRSHTDPGHLMMDGGAIIPLRVRYRSAPGRSDAPGPGAVTLTGRPPRRRVPMCRRRRRSPGTGSVPRRRPA
jgi:hypothetical protein